MPVLFKLNKIVRKFNDGREDPANNRWYAHAFTVGTVGTNDLAEIIQRNCSMKKSDCLAVLTELVEVMKDELQASHSVRIDGLGTFKVGIKGSYAKTAAAFNPAKNISGYKVNFRPSFTTVRTGTYIDDEGNLKVKKAQIAELTSGIQVQAY